MRMMEEEAQQQQKPSLFEWMSRSGDSEKRKAIFINNKISLELCYLTNVNVEFSPPSFG